MTTPHLKPDLTGDEGRRHQAYQDSLGIWTVGVGHAHVAPGTVWNDAQIGAAFERDVRLAEHELDRFLPWWRQLNDPRQDVLVNMMFNMGAGTLLKFKNTLAAIRDGRWQAAHDGMLASRWAKQVHGRANRLAQQMLMGVR